MALKQSISLAACCAVLLLTRPSTITNSGATQITMHASLVRPAATQPSCALPKPGEVACNSILVTPNDLQSVLLTLPHGLGPADLRKAYNIPEGGSGQTVALIDAFDDPNAESDLNVYRSQYGLPACTTLNGCFRKVAEDGSTKYPAANMGWSGETSLDIEMASAICPACNILLVEANSSALNDMAISANRAVAMHANVVSNSYGGREFPEETVFEQNYNHPGVIMTASAGDSGFGAQFPATSRYVVTVGGTELKAVPGGRGFVETAWTGTGSGCSAYEPKPAWQHDNACPNRTANDISFDASPASPVAVYESYCQGSVCGWIQYAGTSVGAPAVAAMYAVAGNAQRILGAQSLYTASRNSLNDVTSGNNGVCVGVTLCTATIGYDAPSGNGTPWGVSAL